MSKFLRIAPKYLDKKFFEKSLEAISKIEKFHWLPVGPYRWAGDEDGQFSRFSLGAFQHIVGEFEPDIVSIEINMNEALSSSIYNYCEENNIKVVHIVKSNETETVYEEVATLEAAL